MDCKDKECKVVCGDKVLATIECNGEGFNLKCTDKGKEMCKNMKKNCC